MLFIDEKHDTYTLMESCWWALGGCCSGWQSAGSRHPEMLGKYPLAAPFVFIQIYLFWFCTIWYYKKYTLAAPFRFLLRFIYFVQFDIIGNIPWQLHLFICRFIYFVQFDIIRNIPWRHALFFIQVYLFSTIWCYDNYPGAARFLYWVPLLNSMIKDFPHELALFPFDFLCIISLCRLHEKMSSISPFVTNWFKILKSATPFLPPAIVPEGNWAKSQLDNSRSKLYELLALCQESWRMCLYLLLCFKRCCWSLTDKELLTYRRWRMRVSLPPHMCLSSAAWMGGSKDQARGGTQ